jgi:hypothetical protein
MNFMFLYKKHRRNIISFHVILQRICDQLPTLHSQNYGTHLFLVSSQDLLPTHVLKDK